MAAAYVLPTWLPSLTDSFMGPSPKAYWYLSRGTGFVSLGLMWASMMLGIGITNKLGRLWPGLLPTMAMHEYTSLLGLFFVTFHGLILLGDQYSKYALAQLLTPFGATQYRPMWVGIGQLGFYVWIIIVATFYLRKSLGKKTWRVVHYASFILFLGGLAHGLMSGTDAGTPWAQYFYWITGGSLLFLLVYRILTSGKQPARVPAASLNPVTKPTPALAPIGGQNPVHRQPQPVLQTVGQNPSQNQNPPTLQ